MSNTPTGTKIGDSSPNRFSPFTGYQARGGSELVKTDLQALVGDIDARATMADFEQSPKMIEIKEENEYELTSSL